MKKLITLIVLSIITRVVTFCQGTLYDPYVGVVTSSPSSPFASSNPPYVAVSGSATFIIGANSGSGYVPISWGTSAGCTTQSCKMVVTVTSTVSKTIITGTPTGGSFASKFDWVLSNSNLLIGTQKNDVNGGDINPGSSGNIIIPIQHSSPSTIYDPIGVTHPCNQAGTNCTLGFTQGFNGVVVNIQPPSKPTNDYPSSLQQDDNNAAYVYARTKLPIQLLEFQTINKETSGIGLTWKTLNESNTKNFEIQRMYGGENNTWMTVGTTPAAGTTSTERTYAFMDKTYAKAEKIYYRIKQIDQSGSYKYTDIRSIQLKEYSTVQLAGYPNPVHKNYHLSFNLPSDAKIGIELIDILGRPISRESYQARAGYNIRDIDFSTLVAGTYILKVAGSEINDSMTVIKVD